MNVKEVARSVESSIFDNGPPSKVEMQMCRNVAAHSRSFFRSNAREPSWEAKHGAASHTNRPQTSIGALIGGARHWRTNVSSAEDEAWNRRTGSAPSVHYERLGRKQRRVGGKAFPPHSAYWSGVTSSSRRRGMLGRHAESVSCAATLECCRLGDGKRRDRAGRCVLCMKRLTETRGLRKVGST